MNELIHDWATISANTVESLKIMGMGILAIFIVITVIMLVVYLLNAIDKKMAMMKEAEKAMAAAKAQSDALPPTAPTNITTTAPATIPANDTVNNVANESAEEEVTMDELRAPKYRKSANMKRKSKYRKMDDED